MSKPLRVGIAGFGLAGQVFHAPLVAATPGLAVSAVVTGNAERAALANSRYPDADVVPSTEVILGDIDLLVVATPNRFHSENALGAIAAGVPVVVDKPLAPTVAQAEEVLSAGGKVTVFQNRRWDGDFLTIKTLLEHGELGEVVRFESWFERFRPESGGGWRESGDPAEGGGQLADLGAHLIDQAIALFGAPVRIYAEVDRRRPGVEADDDVFIALEHAGGVRSHLHMGKVAPLAGPRFRLGGLGGGIAIDGLDPQEAQLADGVLPGDPGYGEREPGIRVTSDGTEEPLPLLAGAYEQFYGAAEKWIREGSPPPVDSGESLLVMRVMEAARFSSERHEVVAFQK
ncbi:MAG: Gfo/Idh/MocA family protein [Solirubrobacterales bacterium]